MLERIRKVDNLSSLGLECYSCTPLDALCWTNAFVPFLITQHGAIELSNPTCNTYTDQGSNTTTDLCL